MGWSGNYCTRPATKKEEAELLLEYFNADGYTLPTRVLKHRLIGSVWYAKVETTREDGSVLRWIAVCLVRWEDGMLLRKMMDALTQKYRLSLNFHATEPGNMYFAKGGADEVYTETLHYSDDDGEEYFDTLEEFLAQYCDKYGLKADATLDEAMAAVNASEDGLLAQISEE